MRQQVWIALVEIFSQRFLPLQLRRYKNLELREQETPTLDLPSETCKKFPACRAALTSPEALRRRSTGPALLGTWCSLLLEGSSFTSVTNTHGIFRCTEPRRLMVGPTGSANADHASKQRPGQESAPTVTLAAQTTNTARPGKAAAFPRLPTLSAGRGRTRRSGLLTAAPSGNCSVGAEVPPFALPRALVRVVMTMRQEIRFWVVCAYPHLITDDIYEN